MKQRRPTLHHPLLHQGFVDDAWEVPLTLAWMIRHVRKAARLLVRQPGKIIAFAWRHPKKFFLESRRILPRHSFGEPQHLGADARSLLADLKAALAGEQTQGSISIVAGDHADHAGAVPANPKRTRILVDLQCCQGASGARGIGRYALELTKALARNASSTCEIWVVLNDRIPGSILPLRDQLREFVPQDRIHIISLPLPVDASRKDSVQHLEITRRVYCHAIAALEPDVLLIASMFEGWLNEVAPMFAGLPPHISRAVIAYDLIPYLDQETHLARRGIREWYFRQMDEFKQAQKFLAISENTRQDLIEHLKLPPDTVVNISAGVSDKFRRMRVGEEARERLLQRLGITRPFVLYAGNFDPHKNLHRAIEAYSRLDRGIRTSHQFVIISPPCGDPAKTKQHLMADYHLDADEIILAGRVTDEELVQLYNLSKAFIFPSLYEGFGFPPLEAMSCGTPAIASNTSSLPEVIGYEEAMFDPLSVDSIRDKLQHVLTDDAFREELSARALVQSKKFSWDITARKTLDFIVPKAHQHRVVESRESLVEGLAAVLRRAGCLEDRQLGLLARSIVMNVVTPRRPQILYEVSVLSMFDAKSGIQRVTRNILTNLNCLVADTYDVRPVVFRRGRFCYADTFAAALPTQIKEQTQDEDLPVEPTPGSFYLAVDLFMDGGEDYWEELRRLRSWNVSCCFVMYDLIPVRFPAFFPPGMHEVFSGWLTRVASIASEVITISEATQNDFVQWMQENQIPRRLDLRIGHFHLGADIRNDVHYQADEAAFADPLVCPKEKPVFLIVSTIEPRKGHEQVLEAFDQLWSEGCDLSLVFVGKQGWGDDEFVSRMRSHPQQGRSFHWLTGLPDAELDRLYKECDALIFASYAEGFGLAIVEAAQHGTPLILRDLPVFREVAGEHAFYFHADRPAELADAIKEWLDLSRHGRAPSSHGVRCMTWEESTRMLLRAMRIECIAERPDDADNKLQPG